MANRKKIINARLFVAIPFKSEDEKARFEAASAAREDLTTGQFLLEIIKDYLDRHEQKDDKTLAD